MIPKNLASLFSRINEYWSPHIVAELNGQHIKIAKIKGEFVWHAHEDEDEAFLVEKGRFRMEYRDSSHWVEEGDLVVVPRGIEHRPVAEEECWIILFEPAGTVNTGDAGGELTKEDLPQLD
jgi:mannose-6-phosphate isomerase-like protein (cupin superfamily)